MQPESIDFDAKKTAREHRFDAKNTAREHRFDAKKNSQGA